MSFYPISNKQKHPPNPPNHINPDKIILNPLQSFFQLDEPLIIGHVGCWGEAERSLSGGISEIQEEASCELLAVLENYLCKPVGESLGCSLLKFCHSEPIWQEMSKLKDQERPTKQATAEHFWKIQKRGKREMKNKPAFLERDFCLISIHLFNLHPSGLGSAKHILQVRKLNLKEVK